MTQGANMKTVTTRHVDAGKHRIVRDGLSYVVQEWNEVSNGWDTIFTAFSVSKAAGFYRELKGES
jgi:hypothetical protein